MIVGNLAVENESVQCVVVSIHSEYLVAAVLDKFREIHRVLRKDGTCWLNAEDGELGKPWELAFALRDSGWYLRSDIVLNLDVADGCDIDRPTKAHEYLFLLTKSARYFYDADAIREPYRGPDDPSEFRFRYGTARTMTNGAERLGDRAEPGRTTNAPVSALGRNKRSVWTIATEAFPEAHFATYPCALVEPCIKAGTSEKGCCPTCGAPWVRVVERGEPDREWQRRSGGDINGEYHGIATKNYATPRDPSGDFKDPSAVKARILAGLGSKSTTGWRASCSHDLEPVACRTWVINKL